MQCKPKHNPNPNHMQVVHTVPIVQAVHAGYCVHAVETLTEL